jgi:hypothetical protein
MIIDDADMARPSFSPHKHDTPLIIDPDRMLPLTVSLQGFQTVTRRDPQIRQDFRLIYQTQFSQGDRLYIGR